MKPSALPHALADALGRVLRDRDARWSAFAVAVAIGTVAGAFSWVLGPMLADWSTHGFHDWGTHTAYRYITKISLGEYGEAPWWHPYLCGGVPAMGLHGGTPNFISPWLPVWLLTDARTAIRLEVISSAIVGSFGVWMLAGRFTRSRALRLLVVVLSMLNSRWALQAAVGHTWHLEYCWMPWTLYFLDRSFEPGKLGDALWGAGLFALLSYHGAIYPAPHTALIGGAYALIVAIATRRIQPIAAIALMGVAAAGLSSVKLFMLADALGQAHRNIESSESIGLGQLAVMLTSRDQAYGARPTKVPAYNWHEWGIYVGVAGFVILGFALLFARGRREHALRLIAVVLMLLGLGSFHPYSPWSLLHELPLFSSMHVPSRFLFPMVLLLAIVFASFVGRWLDERLDERRWLDLVLMVPVIAIAIDLATVARLPFQQAFWMQAPDRIDRAEQFEHTKEGGGINYKRKDWAKPILLSMFANRGLLECYGVPPSIKKGAVAKENKGYKGMAWVDGGVGTAEIVEWSPNRALVRVVGAEPDAQVVYNMNWDPSWRANGSWAENHGNRVSARLPAGADEIEFVYRPRTLVVSVPLSVATLAACVGIPWWLRRRRARTTSPIA